MPWCIRADSVTVDLFCCTQPVQTSPWSGCRPFVTATSATEAAWSSPFWHPNTTEAYVLFRKEVSMPTAASATPTSARAAPHAHTGHGHAQQHVYLAITAKPTPLRYHHPKGSNATKQLAAYTLSVGGIPLGTGPGRGVGSRLGIDVYNITERLLDRGSGSAVVAIECFYGTAAAEGVLQLPTNPDDFGGVAVMMFTGSGEVLSGGGADGADDGGASGWEAFAATAWFKPGATQANGNYWVPAENINNTHAPGLDRSATGGWCDWKQSTSCGTSKWQPAATRARPFSSPVNPTVGTYPISVRSLPAAAVWVYAVPPPPTPQPGPVNHK